MNTFPHTDALCASTQPYCLQALPQGLFERAMAEITGFHCQHSSGYQAWLAAHGLDAQTLLTLDDWSRLPPIPADYFKQRLLVSSSGVEAMELTSSGTSGQFSRMRYDTRSLAAAQGMVSAIFQHYRWDTPQTPCNYLLLSYEPLGRTSLGSAFTDQFLCRYAPANRVVYGLRRTGQADAHEFDCFGVIRALQEFAEEGLPVRIFGFPAFLWQALQRMRDTGVTDVQLAPQSLVLFGGGWKNRSHEQIPKPDLYARIHQQLGIALDRCRDGYGAVEHAVPYIECEHHHLHVPVYARVLVRRPSDSTVQPYGQPGLLQFLSPYITSSPAHAVVMSDLATLRPAADCGCAQATDWFELHGRAGTSASRSCALAAAELLGSH